MNLYYRISDPSDVRDISQQMASWELADNPKRFDWSIQPAAPSENAVWTDGAWIVPPAPTYSPEAWVSQHLSPLQVAALSEFRLALLQANKPLGSNMAGLKDWLEGMMAESINPIPRTFPSPPCSYEEAASEAITGLQS